jgi:ABC-2 type transport system ATP-binding protein
MSVIAVRDLTKTFTVKQKEPGLRGSVRSLLRSRTQSVEAVRGISFEMQRGELLAFIGPNGAGKSTTIKMLTGILFPTSGHAEVLGHVPWRERKQLAYQIGSVFGQKPQLWYHLPPIDTFQLFARIYEVPPAEFRQRQAHLVQAAGIGDLLHTPVRKLSLGQRMKCEIVASLLHGPRVILLDEPTIGLDVVAKQQIRDIIRRLHAEEQVSILLTSHDPGDVERLCKRVIVINHGEIIYDDRVSTLKRRHLAHKTIDVRFTEGLLSTADNQEPAFALAGPGLDQIEILKVGDWGVKLRFDSQALPVERVVHALMTQYHVADLNIADPPMEEIIRAIYRQ